MATNNTTKTVTVDINSKVNSDLSNQLKILQSLFDTMNKSIMNINKSIGSYFSNISKEAKETAKAVKEVTNEVDKADEKEKIIDFAEDKGGKNHGNFKQKGKVFLFRRRGN